MIDGLPELYPKEVDCYLPIHIIFETLEAVTVLKIWRVIPSELPSLR